MAYRRAGDPVWSKTLAVRGTIQYFMIGQEPLHYCILVGEGDDLRQRVVPATDLRAADDQCDECNRWLPRSSFNQGHRDEALICFLCRRTYEGKVAGWSPRTEEIIERTFDDMQEATRLDAEDELAR